LIIKIKNIKEEMFEMDKRGGREERKLWWDEIWRGVLSLQPSNHGLGNIILWFEPLSGKAWQELLSRKWSRRDLRYISQHGSGFFRKKAEELLQQTKKPTQRVVKI